MIIVVYTIVMGEKINTVTFSNIILDKYIDIIMIF